MKNQAASSHAHDCGPHLVDRADRVDVPDVSDEAFERAAALFRAVGDPARLRLLHRIMAGEFCVTELADASGAKLSTLSQQLRILHVERIVRRRRQGKHIFYSLADDHVRELIRAALEHAEELPIVSSKNTRKVEET